MLYSHSFVLFGMAQPTVFGRSSFGDMAVFVFFVISGYLVCESWERDSNPLRFGLRRALRIMPGLFVAVLFTTLVIGTAATSFALSDYVSSNLTWAYVLSNISLVCGIDRLPGVFESNPFPHAVNGSLWSLRYEVLMYAFLVLLGWVAPKHRLTGACCAIFLLFATCWCLGRAMGLDHYSLPIPGLWRLGLELDSMRLANLGALFFAGSLLYLWRVRIPMSPLAALALLAVVAASAGNDWFNPLLWLALPYSVIVAARRLPAPFQLFGATDYSYGIYIYAFPVQQFFSQIAIRNGWTWSVTLAVEGAATVALAASSWHFVERPALAWKKVIRARQVAQTVER